MKVGWETKTLGDVAHVKGGKRAPKGYKLLTEPTDHPYLRVTDFSDSGTIDETDLRYISPEVHREIRNYTIRSADLYISIAGTIGRSGIIPGALDGANLTENACRLVFRPGTYNRFVYYFTLSDYFVEQAGVNTRTAAQPKLALSRLATIKLGVPPVEEQRRIVGILDEAFAGIAAAKANYEANLRNARALFESHLQSVFSQRGEQGLEDRIPLDEPRPQGEGKTPRHQNGFPLDAVRVTRTGGREATLRHIPGKLSLAVGMPSTATRKNWRWHLLTDLARLESGHTPSRRHPEYWGGSIPWIGIQDARENHGRRIKETFQSTNELGIAKSSARVLPEDTVCLSRTASVGYVVVTGRPMATSQDFLNWICSNRLNPEFLKYLLLAEGRESLLRYASGSVHQTIYFPEAKAFHVCCPDMKEQARIVEQCDLLRTQTQRLESIYQLKLDALEALKKSLLHDAFRGAL